MRPRPMDVHRVELAMSQAVDAARELLRDTASLHDGRVSVDHGAVKALRLAVQAHDEAATTMLEHELQDARNPGRR